MEIPSEWLWIVVCGFVVSFVLAFGLGANDVANSFGTSVGAKVLTLVQACILGSIFEVLGAVLIGYKVSDTIRKGIIDVAPYNGTEKLLLLGNLSALSGSCLWLLIATMMRLPVSATHSIVGATVGFSLVAKGAGGVGWMKLGMIVASWFVSPLASGLVSWALFVCLRILILNKEKQLESGLRLLPIFYGLTICINAFSIFHDGSTLLHFDKIPLYGVFILSLGLGLLVTIIVRVFVVPWQRKKIEREVMNMGEGERKGVRETLTNQQGDISDVEIIVCNGTDKTPEGNEQLIAEGDSTNELQKTRDDIEDTPETSRLFSFLQILTAIFGSFAHGGNDVSNAIGPLVALWMIAHEQSVAQKAPTPIWVLLYGGVGISLGLWVWGRRVIKTMGEDLSKITPSSGFCIEVGSALTVLVASKIGFPISTTHCKVGSIVLVGRGRSHSNVDWSLFRNIFIAWVVTLPASGLFSAGLMALFKYLV
ncbi:hypothetical protein ACOMHN_057046 [Nucella lapillus]